MNHQEMSEWLQCEDEKTFLSRLERLKFIVDLASPGKYQQFHGGIITKESFEEAKWCYINASFIACINLCQTTLEHSLSSLFKAVGNDKTAKSGFYKILEESRNEQFITEDEFQFINELRKSRNRVAHPKDNIFDRIEYESVTRNMHVYEIIEENAKHAIQTCFNIYSRKPFSV